MMASYSMIGLTSAVHQNALILVGRLEMFLCGNVVVEFAFLSYMSVPVEFLMDCDPQVFSFLHFLQLVPWITGDYIARVRIYYIHIVNTNPSDIIACAMDYKRDFSWGSLVWCVEGLTLEIKLCTFLLIQRIHVYLQVM
jgi:hypothetical protein